MIHPSYVELMEKVNENVVVTQSLLLQQSVLVRLSTELIHSSTARRVKSHFQSLLMSLTKALSKLLMRMQTTNL